MPCWVASLSHPGPGRPEFSPAHARSTYPTKGGPARLGYYDNYLVDASSVIVGVQATLARLSQESAATRDMIERYRERCGSLPQTLAAHKRGNDQRSAAEVQRAIR